MSTVSTPGGTRGFAGWLHNPWRKPRVLQWVTIGYLSWSILPVLIAILMSFNAGRSNTVFQTFGLRWWIDDPDQQALFHHLRPKV